MKQRVLTLVLPIRSETTELEAIRKNLRDLGDEILSGQTQRFESIEKLHFFSCGVLEEKNGSHPCLLVELSFDGSARDFVRQFVAHKREALDRILAHCDGYPGADAKPGEVIRFLKKGRHRNQAVYLGTPGRSVRQITLEERGLRGALAEALQETSGSAMSREERWRRAVATVSKKKSEQTERPFLPAPRRPLRVRSNPASPLYRARVRAALPLLAWIAFWLAGVGAALMLARKPWHAIPVVAVPAALAATAAALVFLRSPRRLKARARLSVSWVALREFAGTALWLVPLGGLVVAAFELPWQSDWLDAALFWGVSFGLAIIPVLLAGALVFVLVGGHAAVASALVAAGMLAWRSRVSPSALAEIGLTALASAVVVALLVGLYAIALRRREIDRVIWDEDEDIDRIAEVARRECAQYQSHLISETEVESGRLRMATLRAVLRTVDLLARYWFNLGHLAGIPSIHFARFLVLPERRSLVFLSNYDDRFDDYLGQFASVWGVTATWGNTVQVVDGRPLGFPRPYLLVFDGARRENLFKRYSRASQLESLIWYSAYPDLSVAEIERATALRECMSQPIEDHSTGFLADLRRWWRPPLDEAALAALIEAL